MPKISIIVPVYNVENYLKNCIDSILNQTFKDFELILVNDGSTDNSLTICENYKSIDNRIQIVNKKNGGASSARNAGLDIAIGEYIGFVDSDDYIHPQMYQILYKQITKIKADISMCDFEKVYNFNEKLLESNDFFNKDIQILNNEESLFELLGENSTTYIIPCNKLYKKKIFNNIKFREGIIHEDEYIIHRLLYKANKLVYIKEKLYFYLQREGSVMNKKLSIEKVDYLLACSDRVKFFYEKNLTDLKIKWQNIYLWNFFMDYLILDKDYHNHNKLLILISDFRKLLKILLKSKNYLLKEKISWIIFAINPNIYYRLKK